MPSFEIAIKTTDDPRGIQSATEETLRLNTAMGKLLERAKRKEEFATAQEKISQMSQEERSATLEAYKLAAAQDAANRKIGETGQATGKATGLIAGLKTSWMEMAGAISVAQTAIQVGQTVWRETGERWMTLADQTRELQQAIGATAEEASTLIAIADDVQISAEDIQRGFEGAIRKGFAPSVEGLAEMATQFQSIQNPIEKTRFLMDTFGRTGNDLYRFLMLDSDQLRAMAEEAEKTNQVLSDSDMLDAQNYREAADAVGDSWNSLLLTAGKTIIPAVTDLLNLWLRYNETMEESHGLLRLTGVWGIAISEVMNLFGKETEKATEENDKLNESLDETNNQIVKLTGGMRGSIYDFGNRFNPGDEGYNPSTYVYVPPGMANGGPVRGGQPYIVNENRALTGPEVFVPNTDGMIYPSVPSAQQALGGGGTVVQVNLSYQPMIGLGTRREAEEVLLPYIKNALQKMRLPA